MDTFADQVRGKHHDTGQMSNGCMVQPCKSGTDSHLSLDLLFQGGVVKL